MSLSIGKVIQEMGPFALAIAVALVLMAIASLTVLVERLWTFTKYVRLSREFGALASSALERGEEDAVLELAASDRFGGSPLARVLGAGMKTHARASKRRGLELPAIELARRELAREVEAVEADVRRGLGILASVGSVAPFVGLLGTVVGIIAAFEGIAAEGSGGLGVVSAGIAEALFETALGLLVAIPSVLAFNYLTTRSDAILLAVDHAKGEFLDHLESRAPSGMLEEVRPNAA
jgi:biopolymer transport protein ExbB